MHVIQNLCNRLVLIPLNSRTTVHLSPLCRSKPIEDVELKDNTKVAKLAERRVIRLEPVKDKRMKGKRIATKTSRKKKDSTSRKKKATRRKTTTRGKSVAKRAVKTTSRKKARRKKATHKTSRRP